MSYYIPFEIQSEIMKRLPVKSIVQFRTVSKQWKSFIDYHINHPNPQHHLLLQYKLDSLPTYTSIIDDNTFPQQNFPLTTPEPLNKLKFTTILGSVDGLVCFYGLYKDTEVETGMVVLWNPSVMKFVGIPIRNVFFDTLDMYTRIAFGVCPQTNDPTLLKIKVFKTPSICWDVQVFTLSSRVWRTVYTGVPFKSCDLFPDHVYVDGIIYWSSRGGFILSFDLKSDKFGEVSIPERYIPTYGISVAKVNELLGLLEYYDEEGGMSLCGVWMRKDGVTFTKIYTIKVEGKSVFNSVLVFRNNGEVLLQLDDDDFVGSTIDVFEPSSGCTNNVGISGENDVFGVWSYMETLLLLDESNSIIH